MINLQQLTRLSIGLITMNLIPASFASEAVSLQRSAFSDIKQFFQAQIPGVMQSSKDLPQDSLHVLEQHRDRKHTMHTRMQQYYLGIPVLGGYAILHSRESARQMFLSNETPKSMNGVVYKHLSNDLGPLPENYINKGQKALTSLKTQLSNQDFSEENVRPIIYIDKEKRAHWAYQVSVLVTHEDKIPERPTMIVDARSFQTYLKWDAVKKIKTVAKGRGFGGNINSGLYQYGQDYPSLEIMRETNSGVCYMENERVQVVNMAHRYRGYNSTMRFACRNEHQQPDGTYLTGEQRDGYDEINGAYSPTNDALFFANVIADMYKNWYGTNVLEKNGKPMKLVMRVHFGRDYSNAFWDGEQMTYGDGDDSLYPLVSLEISAHEISHGFTEQHSGLMYFAQSGALDESFSDMAAQTAQFYLYGKNDWKIGAGLDKKNGNFVFRYMDIPSQDGKSIDRAEQYNEKLNVHKTSGVYNRVFYLLATKSNWDPRKAFQVMLTANADYWTPTTTFDEAACGIIEAAKQNNFSVEDVKSVLDQATIHYDACAE